MNLTVLVIALISVGSVLMYSNLKVFCAKRYFHSFVTNYSMGRQTLQLNRKVDSSDSSYHSWDLIIEKQSQMFKTLHMSYTLKEGQIPNISLSQPKLCPILITTIHELEKSKTDYNWDLKDFHISNNVSIGAQVKYTRVVFITTGRYPSNELYKTDWKSEKSETWLIPKDLWLSGILCQMSDKTFYVFVEEINSMNTPFRSQYVTRLKFIGKSVQTKNVLYTVRHIIIERTTRPHIEFTLDSMNKTIHEFLGIDCQNIETEFNITFPTPEFGAVGEYPAYQHLDVNLPECGLNIVPISHEIHFASNCFSQQMANKSVFYFDRSEEELRVETSERVFGGEDAQVGESPWTVIIGAPFIKEDRLHAYMCTGVLITFQWVLTAAHCYKETPNDIAVAIGPNLREVTDYRLSNKAHFYRHPYYVNPPESDPPSERERNLTKLRHDIALIKLKTPFTRHLTKDFQYLINTVCLPTGVVNTSSFSATYFGFGTIDETGRYPDILQKGQVELAPSNQCASKLFCAKFNFPNQSRPCHADSGGPLLIQIDSRRKRNVLIGIARSISPKGVTCSSRIREAIWTPVPNFIDWILTTITEYN